MSDPAAVKRGRGRPRKDGQPNKSSVQMKAPSSLTINLNNISCTGAGGVSFTINLVK